MNERPPDADTFSQQFRRKYGREMTPEERRFYELTRNLLENPPEEEEAEVEPAEPAES